MTPGRLFRGGCAVIDGATDVTLPESSATLRRVLLVDTRSPRHSYCSAPDSSSRGCYSTTNR